MRFNFNWALSKSDNPSLSSFSSKPVTAGMKKKKKKLWGPRATR